MRISNLYQRRQAIKPSSSPVPPMPSTSIALFPLNTVLFPDGPLPLRIFEPRYLEMVSDCMKNDRPFGVCLIAEGREAGEASVPHEYGTLARIEDWGQLEDGTLGITARGGERFIILQTHVAPNHLITSEIEILEDDGVERETERDFHTLVEVLRKALPGAGPLYRDIPPRWDDPSWVAYRIAELLPPDNAFKLELLRAGSPDQRLELVFRRLKSQAARQ
jgi:uncharacterized protein